VYYLVEFQPVGRVDVAGVQVILNQFAINWYRFAPTSWVIITLEDAATWTARLRPSAEAIEGGFLFICRLDLADRQGWMPEKFWNWLRQN